MKKIIDFSKLNGLVPAVIQEEKTKDVLMLGFMNKEAFDKTVETGFVWFWSRKRKKLWMKGETSGNTLQVKKIFVDCDNDTVLITACLQGNVACHTGNKTCFFEEIINI